MAKQVLDLHGVKSLCFCVCVHAMFKDFMEYMLALLKQADT
jgi:hypothetical protein